MGRSKKGNIVNGWLILEKPEGLTSTQSLGKARRILNARKVGHAGTLDPLATGVLPLAFGEATKTVPYCQDAEKTYQFTVQWGAATNTDDSEGEVIETSDLRPTKAQVLDVMNKYLGDIEQTPPQFSAIKIDGKRAYAMARKGETVEIAARPVTLYRFDLLEVNENSARFECECSKGTYVRALARDMGRDLGCFGHITQLRRTAVGNFHEKDAISLDELSEMVQDAPANDVLHPVESPLDDIPALYMTESEIRRLRNGLSVTLFSKDGQNRIKDAGLDPRTADTIVLARSEDQPIALVALKGVEGQPIRVFNL